MKYKNNVWVYIELNNGIVNNYSFEAIEWGKKISKVTKKKLCSIVLCDKCDNNEIEKLFQFGSEIVYICEDRRFHDFSTIIYAKTLEPVILKYTPEIFIASATRIGRSLMPYLAMKLHTGLTADCINFEIEDNSNNLIQVRPAIGESVLAKIITPINRPQMATIRPNTITPTHQQQVIKKEVVYIEPQISLIRDAQDIIINKEMLDEKKEITNVDVLIGGGKGLFQKENFKLLQNLSEIFEGEVVSSRPPVDDNWLPYNRQVGLTGKSVSPKVYFAIGISGSVQHLVGIQSSKQIIAINTDPKAQIFRVSDLGIVGDLFKVVPILINYYSNWKTREDTSH